MPHTPSISGVSEQLNAVRVVVVIVNQVFSSAIIHGTLHFEASIALPYSDEKVEG